MPSSSSTKRKVKISGFTVLNRFLDVFFKINLLLSSSDVQKIFDNAVIHTTKGDIHVKLFSKETPKSVENFCVHSKNG